MRLAKILFALALGVTVSRGQFEYGISFDLIGRRAETYDPFFQARVTGPGFRHWIGWSALEMRKTAGTLNGSADYTSTFELVDDFSVGTSCVLNDGEGAKAGLVAHFRNGTLRNFISLSPSGATLSGFGQADQSAEGSGTSVAQLEIRRRGNTISALRSGKVIFTASGDIYREPVKVGLYLAQTAEHEGENLATFEHITMTSDTLNPSMSIMPNGRGQIILQWLTQFDLRLELMVGVMTAENKIQWSPANLPVEGDGNLKRVVTTIGETPRYYQIVPF